MPSCNDQPPYKDDSAYDRAEQDIQCKHGDTPAERATARYDPKKHSMDSERQSAQKPQQKIVRATILCASGFENEKKYCRGSNGQKRFLYKRFLGFFSCHDNLLFKLLALFLLLFFRNGQQRVHILFDCLVFLRFGACRFVFCEKHFLFCGKCSKLCIQLFR